MLTYQDKRYRYDGFGRMIEKRSVAHGVQHFTYDAEHRLIEVRSTKGQRETLVKMSYDPLGRRIAKTEHDNHGYLLGETRFTWDGLRLLQEHKHSQTSLYLYDNDSYEPLARIDGTGEHQRIRYYHNDLNGLPEQLTEADGRSVWQARYQVWGNTAEEMREPYYIEEQNLRFQGQYLDREIGLHYNTFRFYDPDVGRFTTPDPIGLAGGINLYQYAPNSASWIDPLGLSSCDSTWKSRRNFNKNDSGLKSHARRHSNLSPWQYLKRGQKNITHGKMLKGGGRAPDAQYHVMQTGENTYSVTIANRRGEILSIDTWNQGGANLNKAAILRGLRSSGVTPPMGFWENL